MGLSIPDVQFSRAGDEVWFGVDVHSFNINAVCNQEANRPEDSAVVSPVARMTTRQHVLIEGVVYADVNGVALSEREQA